MVANPKIALIGSVNSSLQTLRKLVEHQLNLVHVLGLNPSNSSSVSGYRDIKVEAEKFGIEASYFSKVNETHVYDVLKNKEIDLLFIIGLSQMVREPLLSLANVGNVGFHPTRLQRVEEERQLHGFFWKKQKEQLLSFYLMKEWILVQL